MAIRRWKGIWQADISLPGRRRKRKNFSTKREAEAWEDHARTQLRQGIFPTERQIHFRDFSKIYLERKNPGRTLRAIKTDHSRMRNLNDFFGDYFLLKITPGMIEDFKASRLNKVAPLKAGHLEKVAPSTVNRDLALLRHLLKRAVDWGFLNQSPFRGISFYREPQGRERVLSKTEFEELLTNSSPSLRIIILIAYHAGLRKGEILDLRWSDIDLKNGFITVRSSKINETRTVPLHSVLIEELKQYPPRLRSDFVIPNPQTGERLDSFKSAWNKAIRESGIEGFRFHDLRHTFASNLAMSGSDPMTIKKFTGHKTLGVLMRYSHLSDKHLREALERMKSGGN